MNFTDEALLQACIKKDSKAQYQLFKLCYSFLLGIAFRYVKNRDDADDLVNRAFLKVLNNLEKFRKEVPFTLWMRRIMINTIIDEFRKNRKEKELMQKVDFSEYYGDFDESVINDFLRKSDAEYLHKMISELPPTSQRVFNLYVIDGYSHKEVGELLGMSEGTSKWHLNFARNKLKEMIYELTTPLKKVANE